MKTQATRTIDMLKKAASAILALALAFGLLPAGTSAAYAADPDIPTVLALDGISIAPAGNTQSAALSAQVSLTDEGGNYIASGSYKNATVKINYKNTAGGTARNNSGTLEQATSGSINFGKVASGYLEVGSDYEVYATFARAKNTGSIEYPDTSNYFAAVTSNTLAVSVKSQPAPQLSATGTLANTSNGAITVEGSGSYQYAQGSVLKNIYESDWEDVPESGEVTGLSPATYWVRGVDSVQAAGSGYDYLVKSDAVSVEVPTVTAATYTVTTGAAEHASWGNYQGSYSIQQGDRNTLTLRASADEGYVVTGAVAEPAANAIVSFDASTGIISVSGVSGDVSIVPAVEEKPWNEVGTVLALGGFTPNRKVTGIGVDLAVAFADSNGNAVSDTGASTVLVYYRYTDEETGEAKTEVKKPSFAGKTSETVTLTGLAAGRSYEVWAEYEATQRKSDDTTERTRYASAATGRIALSVAAQEAPELAVTPATGSGAKADGTVTAAAEGAYEWVAKGQFASADKINPENWEALDGAQLTGLAAGTYYVRAVERVVEAAGGYEYLLASPAAEAVVETYVPQEYEVTLANPENYSWRSLSSSKTITEKTGFGNFAVTPDAGYYVESVTVEPEGAAEVQFDQQTGNVTVTGATSDFTLAAHAKRLVDPVKLEVVGWELLPQDSVDALFDSNSRATVRFTVKATGSEGQPAPAVSIGFSTDNEASAYDLLEFSRATDLDGLATFKVRFPVGEYLATFTAKGADVAPLVASQPLAVATQETPVLYESAITNVSAPGAADGSYRGLEDGLEYFTYPLKATEFDAPYFRYDKSGEAGGWWQAVENGEITGLSAGTYAVRAAQRADQGANTVYLFSDYATFPIANAFRTVTANAEGSSHVTFAEQSQATKQNGTVYFTVSVEDGYVLDESGISVDYPAYAASIAYYPSVGKIRVTGVTRDLKLTASAVPVVTLKSSNVAAIGTQAYTGGAVTPEPAVKVNGKTLKKGVDYTLSYAGNKAVGTAKVTVTGKSKYSGVVTKSFKIAKTSVAAAKIGAIATQSYTGSAIKPALSVTLSGKKLARGVDYTVTYSGNVKAGTATAKVTGTGKYTGSVSRSFKIARTSIAKATFSKIAAQKLKKAGKAVKPKFTVKYAGQTLKAGADYTVAYKNNKKKGTAKAVITGKGGFNATKTIKFKIK